MRSYELTVEFIEFGQRYLRNLGDPKLALNSRSIDVDTQ